MSERTGLGKTKLFSYIVIEKLLDFTFFVFLFFLVTAASAADVVEDMLLYSGIAVAIGVTVLILYIRFNPVIVDIMTRRAPDLLSARIKSLNDELLSGIYLFRSLRQVAKSGALFLSGWTCIVIIFYLVSWPFLGPLNLPFYAPLILMVFSALSLAIPSAPSAIGTMHFAFLIAIRLMTDDIYDVDLAVGFIVVLHFFVILFDFLVGAVVLSTYNLRRV